jgi:hypothetical protein
MAAAFLGSCLVQREDKGIKPPEKIELNFYKVMGGHRMDVAPGLVDSLCQHRIIIAHMF